MTIFDSIILGIIEGFTEFLPISSTGHLILVSKLLGLDSDDFLKSFQIIIQLGAILAVIVIYFKRIISDYELIKRAVIAFIPTAIAGFFMYRTIKSLLGSDEVVLITLLLGGLFIIIFEKFIYKFKIRTEFTYKDAFLIGIFQILALVPGVSRAAATIIGGMFLGMHRRDITEFSFILAIPTMLAASGYDLYKNYELFTAADLNLLLIGFITSFVVAIFAIKFQIGRASCRER